MNSFDEISLAYDNTIDWVARLNREIPFLVSLLNEPEKKRVLDIACGSGRHSVALAAQGAEVVGFDMSRTMIEAAQKHAEENRVKPTFIVADMVDIDSIVEGYFDLIFVLGNSLALLHDIDSVRSLVETIYQRLNDGGSFLAQVLNFEEIHWTGFRNFPTKTGKLNDGTEVTFSRIFEHSDYPVSSTLIMSVFRKTNDDWVSEVSTQKVLNLNYSIMSDMLNIVGFRDVEFFSDYNESPFEKKVSRNMVIRAIR
ncbi:MAG: class I SAM-dependent methyltransferase [Candidatus Thorarchaeota archaeon]|nr:class I SAM-dependent methyltransferase [Candidatus Thorarchaeota archaeon]